MGKRWKVDGPHPSMRYPWPAVLALTSFPEHPINELIKASPDKPRRTRTPKENGCDRRREPVVHPYEGPADGGGQKLVVTDVSQRVDLGRSGIAIHCGGDEATFPEIHIKVAAEWTDGFLRFAAVEDHPGHHRLSTALTADPTGSWLLRNTRDQADSDGSGSLTSRLMIELDEVPVGRQIDSANITHGEVSLHAIVAMDEPVAFVSGEPFHAAFQPRPILFLVGHLFLSGFC